LVAQRRDGHRLLQVGGLLLPARACRGSRSSQVQRYAVALSTHLLGITQGTFLMVGGATVAEAEAHAEPGQASGEFLGLTYGCLAAWTANLLGAVWGAGGSMVPMAAGGARGSAFQEATIRVPSDVGLPVSLVCVAVLILWGLRTAPPTDSGAQ